MSKLMSLLKRSLVTALLVALLGGLAFAAFVFQDDILASLIQTDSLPQNTAPIVKVISDLPVAPVPEPVQQQALLPVQAAVIRNVVALKDAQQQLALAKLEAELGKLAHEKVLRDMELEKQQWIMTLARIQAKAQLQPTTPASVITKHTAIVTPSIEAPITNANKALSPVKKGVKKPRLLGILSDNSSVLWFNQQQHVMHLKQTIGPVTLVKARQRLGEVDVIFNGRLITLPLNPALARRPLPSSSSSSSQHAH